MLLMWDPTKAKKKQKKKMDADARERADRSQPAPAGMPLHLRGCSSRPLVLFVRTAVLISLSRITN
jgi:hypothetical protein